MLKTLDIRTLVLIDHLTLEASAGLTVLTGETGAGKSILLDALGLIRGDRADAGLVRTGAEAAIVTAVLSLPPDHLVLAELSAAGVVIDDDEIRLKREQRVDGKSRAFINEQPVGVQTLKSVGRLLIDLHGQFDTGALFDPSTHRDMADRFAGLFAHRGQVADAWASVSSARAELQAAQATAANSARDAEYRRGLLDEIKKLSPEDGEEDHLLVRKQMLSHQEQVREGLQMLTQLLDGDKGVVPQLVQMGRTLDRLRGKTTAPVDSWADDVAAALSTLRDRAADIDRALFDLDGGGETLEQIDDRLYALRGLARKLGCAPAGIVTAWDRLRAEHQAGVNAEDQVGALTAALAAAKQTYDRLAADLSAARAKARTTLDRAVMKELPPLKLDKAIFVTEQIITEPGPTGIDQLRFMVAPNPGLPPAPLDKTASGGELSRLLLALKVVLATRENTALTMIFDEVDSGLGGAVAAAMADRLARLAKTVQVLVVTHAPQIAAAADHHWVVRKSTTKGTTTTSVDVLTTMNDRQEEIARMLSGKDISTEARAAAKKLLHTVAA